MSQSASFLQVLPAAVRVETWAFVPCRRRVLWVDCREGSMAEQSRRRLITAEHPMTVITSLAIILLVVLVAPGLAVRIVKQYERGVLFRLGRLRGVREPGLRLIIPFVDVLHRVSLRVVTMPIQSQGIITRDNVSVDVSAVAYFRVVDVVKSVVAIENVRAAINQIAQTTLRKVVGQHTLDETLSETDRINQDIREILDITTVEWGVEVTLVELKDIQLPDSMKRAMARQAEAKRKSARRSSMRRVSRSRRRPSATPRTSC